MKYFNIGFQLFCAILFFVFGIIEWQDGGTQAVALFAMSSACAAHSRISYRELK